MNDGGPAFPIPDAVHPNGQIQFGANGMSLRDWFASQERISKDDDFGWPVMEALAGPRPSGSWTSNPLEWFAWSNTVDAKIRYARADAMLKARLEGGAQ